MSSDNKHEVSSPKKRRINDNSVHPDSIIDVSEKSVSTTRKDDKKARKHVPKFRLKASPGELASLSTDENERIPLMLTDVQYLLLHSLLGNLNLTQSPRWYVLEKCNNIKQTTCLVLEGISIDQWQKHNELFPNVNKIFTDFVEILTPSVYGGSLVDELALVPLSEIEKDELIQKYGSMNLALEARKDLMVMMRAVFPISDDISPPFSFDTEDKYPRTQLMLSAWQLIEENYPLPLKGKLQNAYADYVMTKDTYEPVTANSPMFGLDCEMCMTNAGSELTRVSIVNEKHESIYESLVKPYNNITDYLTRYSGITKSLLENVTKRLEDVQKEIREVLPPDAILVGQSLNVDLHALKIMHPYVIDTSLIFNFTGERSRRPKLKVLAREFLKEKIQEGNSGHCSVEDSIASLKLVQLKLSKTVDYGDAVHTNRQGYKENIVKKLGKAQDYALSIFNHMIEQKKTSIVIGCDDITGDYHTYLKQAKDSLHSQLKKTKPKKVKLSTVDSSEDVVSSLCEVAKEHNFSMAHLKVETLVCEADQMQKVDAWISRIWNSLGHNSFFVVLFGGSTTHNGIAMMKVKSSL